MVFRFRVAKEGLEICGRGDLEKRGSSGGSKQNISPSSDDVTKSRKRSIHGAIRPWIVRSLRSLSWNQWHWISSLPSSDQSTQIFTFGTSSPLR